MRAPEVVWNHVAPLFEESEGLEARSFVYFIGEHDGPLKIGVGKDPLMRLRSLQTGNPRRLRIERVLLGDRPTEQFFHETWREFSISSRDSADEPVKAEWFVPEIREELEPIAEDALRRQRAYLARERGCVAFRELLALIREAHIAHDFVFRPRDEAHYLASGAAPDITVNRSRL